MPTFHASRFDGRRAEARRVTLRIERGYLVVEADGTVLERERLRRAAVSEPYDGAPRLVTLPSGTTLEVPDPDRTLARALEQAGLRLPLAARLQRWWPGVIVALAVALAAVALAYTRGVPLAAQWAASLLPSALETRLGDQLLAVLDRHYFRESDLDPARRERLEELFAHAVGVTAPGVRYRLEFRSAGPDGEGVNAFALPGGTIVLLDGLVEVAEEEDAVLGVLGHELGHVVHRHAARKLLQSVGVGALAGLLWGDFSGVAAGLPVVLGMLSYSRDAEREADEFAIAFLRGAGRPVRPLHDFFTKLESRLGLRGSQVFLSTHPSPEERLERLRRAM